ncbi:type II CAAX endopeptidase family protein [Halobellus ruber]|uniref:CPBP family intramembrane metalloprotease n=1 Tax=Halobellus ruber TaxID=2761102 RepID=A0A7J9SIC3_9EURY|nr:type II CAAX endopeptidase family protein [Halobellus ruber]MBB6645879.1 CPBP family intramembrane metalloprotease [Halobellus ruber]
MPEWATFVGFAAVVTSGLLVLSHASRGVIDDGSEAPDRTDSAVGPEGPKFGRPDADRSDTSGDGLDTDRPVSGDANRAPPSRVPGPDGRSEAIGADAPDATPAVDRADTDPRSERVVLPKSGVTYRPSDARSGSRAADDADPLSTPSLLANVAVSQGLFGALLLVGAWYAEIPAWAFGVGSGTTGLPAVATGVGLGVALYVANEAGAAIGARFGFDVGDGQRLRGALAPDTSLGWVLLLLVVLPVIAGFEEVLFRGALIGVAAAGYDVSPWLLAVVASGAFALGHGAQGRLGVVVTGALGFVLAAAFVVSGSLLVVIVAHYLVNALEFVVHEGLGAAWPPDSA